MGEGKNAGRMAPSPPPGKFIALKRYLCTGDAQAKKGVKSAQRFWLSVAGQDLWAERRRRPGPDPAGDARPLSVSPEDHVERTAVFHPKWLEF